MDSLSLLPEHLISSILSFLPFNEAVRTSVLSRRWRPLWAHITDFDIDGGCISPNNLTKQIQCIDSILSSPQLTILKFKISLSSSPPDTAIAHWVRNLAERKVTEVSLLSLGHVSLQCLLSSKSLTKLKLGFCELHGSGSPALVACPSLKHIELHHVRVSHTTIREILSACENLNSMKIKYGDSRACQFVVKHQRLEYFGLRATALRCDVDIETSSLRELELEVRYCTRRIRVSAPMVRKSRVCIPGRDLSWSLREVLAGIGSTEELQLGPEVVQCLSSCFTPLEFASTFQKLKKLQLIDVWTKDSDQTSALTSLLQSCSQLLELYKS